MYIDVEEMKKLHNVQIIMFKELQRVMTKLNVTYFFVHGSLLGTVTRNDFIPEDDDIDIALFRKDYDKLVSDGNYLINRDYFIQSCTNDDYPLPFAKMRATKTAFIQPVLYGYSCNKGIYIDIFPIDYGFDKSLKEKWLQFKVRMLTQRLFVRFADDNFIKKALRILLCIRFPSYIKAVEKREEIYKSVKLKDYVNITGGKASERYIPIGWFGDVIEMEFCGCLVNCPKEYKKYLRQIYGKDYEKYNPAKSRMTTDGIEVSADIIDINRSYKEYM